MVYIKIGRLGYFWVLDLYVLIESYPFKRYLLSGISSFMYRVCGMILYG
jgi:hypothetical protein